MTTIRAIQVPNVVRVNQDPARVLRVIPGSKRLVRLTATPAPVLRVSPNASRVLRIAAQGPQGPQGPQGIPGPPGAAVIQGVAAETISALQIVFFDASGARVASAADFAEVIGAVGIATTSATVGNTFNYQVAGELSDSSWAWTPSTPLYLSDSGVLSPTPGTHVRNIAVAISPTAIVINLQIPTRR